MTSEPKEQIYKRLAERAREREMFPCGADGKTNAEADLSDLLKLAEGEHIPYCGCQVEPPDKGSPCERHRTACIRAVKGEIGKK